MGPDTELRFLRRWGWLFPALGLPMGCVLAGAIWSLVTLDKSLVPQTLVDWVSLKGLVFGALIGSVPLFWRIGIWVENRVGATLRRFGVGPIGAFLVFVGCDGALRSYSGQTLLWQSVRVRAGESYFARELALFRLYAAEVRRFPPERPGVVVAGTSQMLHALDAPSLAEIIGRPVHRRAVAGMFPLELCASLGFLSFYPRNDLLLMFSGFDLGARDRIYQDAIRPLATREGVALLYQAADVSFLFRHWRAFVDFTVAAHIELWRSRDYLRWVLDHPLGARSGASHATEREQVNAQRAGYMALGSNRELLQYSGRLMDLFFERASTKFRRIFVVEGQLNPSYPDRNVDQLHSLARAIAQNAQRKGWVHYVPIERQKLQLELDDWLDMAHVNNEGRNKFTIYLGNICSQY